MGHRTRVKTHQMVAFEAESCCACTLAVSKDPDLQLVTDAEFENRTRSFMTCSSISLTTEVLQDSKMWLTDIL